MFSKWFKSRKKVAEAPPSVDASASLFDTSDAPAAPPVESPCNGVCDMDWKNDICVGCFRTPGEIGRWRSMSDAQKRDVVAAAEVRAQQASA